MLGRLRTKLGFGSDKKAKQDVKPTQSWFSSLLRRKEAEKDAIAHDVSSVESVKEPTPQPTDESYRRKHLRAKEASLNTLVSDRKTVADSLDTKDISLDDENLDVAAAKVVSQMFKKVESGLNIPEIVITEAEEEVKQVVDEPIKVDESQVTQAVPEAKIEVPVIEIIKEETVQVPEPVVVEEPKEASAPVPQETVQVPVEKIEERDVSESAETTKVEIEAEPVVEAKVEETKIESEEKPQAEVPPQVDQDANETAVASENEEKEAPVAQASSANAASKKNKKKNKKKGKK